MKLIRVSIPKEPARRPRWMALVAALLAVCVLCAAVTMPTYITASASERQLPIYCVQREYKVCALTFDAAWGEARVRSLTCKGLNEE